MTELEAYKEIVKEQGRALGKIDGIVQSYPHARELCDQIHQIIAELYPNKHFWDTQKED